MNRLRSAEWVAEQEVMRARGRELGAVRWWKQDEGHGKIRVRNSLESLRWKSWFATIPPQFGRLTVVGREVCFSLAPIGRVAVRAPKEAGAGLYRRESFLVKKR